MSIKRKLTITVLFIVHSILCFLYGYNRGGSDTDCNIYYKEGYNQALHDCINNTYEADTLITYKPIEK